MVSVRPVALRASGSVDARRSAFLTSRSTLRAVGMVGDVVDVPSRTDGSGTFTVATWNIRSGRAGGLESALRAAKSLGVDIILLTEAKLTQGIYARNSSGYSVLATDAASPHQGGVALCVKNGDDNLFEVEGTTKHGPNVIAFHLETGCKRYYIVGAYIPPSDRKTIDDIRDAWQQCPEGSTPILLGDLNVNLRDPKDDRDEEVAEECSSMGLSDMSRHFRQRRRRRMRGRWTWRMRRRGRDISSQPDYFLAREGDRRDFRGVTLRAPRHHDSDHRAVIATVYAGTARRLAGYIRRRSRFPVRLQRMATHSHVEQIFEQLKATCEAPPKRERKENVWIQPATWALIDTRAALRKEGKLT